MEGRLKHSFHFTACIDSFMQAENVGVVQEEKNPSYNANMDFFGRAILHTQEESTQYATYSSKGWSCKLRPPAWPKP
jgi:hypothetical protein